MAWRIAFATLLVGLMLAGFAADAPDAGKERAALAAVKKYAFEAFPQWAMTRPEQVCPRSLDELRAFAGEHPIDPWGTPLAMKCGAPIRGLFVYSAGPDRTLETEDDITSNTER